MKIRHWHYEPVSDFGRPLTERLRQCPREPGMLVYALRLVANLLLRLSLRTVFRFRVHGRERLAKPGSCILVCNHTSHLDTLCLVAAIPVSRIHRTYPAAASDYFFSDFARTAFSSILINALPFDRHHGGAESLDRCASVLGRPNTSLIVFPEGTRTTDGEVARFRSGVARLAQSTGLPVVPCHVTGGFECWPKGRCLPRPGRLELRVGEAMHFDETTDVATICRELRDAVITLKERQ
ncbi:MAG: lysophospholipid acyltransferase family protein [Woeseiaceae bacterium]|nr:lysophospholipid acyltransferase family protein [Woeseiaceae bacterium]